MCNVSFRLPKKSSFERMVDKIPLIRLTGSNPEPTAYGQLTTFGVSIINVVGKLFV
jgi:hypothetical protein